MSDANVPLPREPDSSEISGGHSPEREVSSPWISKPKAESTPKSTQKHQDWQTVNFPNAINIDVDNIPLAPTDNPTNAAAPTASPHPSAREAELLKLVGDLNQCNDNLLRRIAQLEETLEHSQAALQAEIERSQEPERSEPPAAAPNPNAQVAQLVSELDATEQALQRQRILTETLQAQLETSQQRVAQLERECALIQQRYTKQSQVVMEAEATCRDLRSRLQRQQHYTLQFKAALEKSLDMSSHSSQPPSPLSRDDHSRLQPTNRSAPPISMPKAQRIQPWSADAALPGQTPNLDVLIRGLTPSSPNDSSNPAQTPQIEQQPAALAPFQSSSAQRTAPPDAEAEMLLWRDMERVIAGSRKLSETVAFPSETAEASDQLALQPTPAKQSDQSAESNSKSPFELKPKLNPTSVSATSQEEALTFSEPSPWGEPLKGAQQSPPSPSSTQSAAMPLGNQSRPMVNHQSADSLPLTASSPPKPSAIIPVTATQTAEVPPALNPQSVANSPSPIVYPLRPQKKIKSLAAVELPNFPRQQSPRR